MKNCYSLTGRFTLLFLLLCGSPSLLSQGPINNDCGSPIPLSVDVNAFGCFSRVSGTNVGATASGETPIPSCSNFGDGADVWFSVTVPENGIVSIDGSGATSPRDWAMSIYSGTCGNLTEIDCDDNSGFSTFPRISLEGQTPGDVLLIRFFEFENNDFGDFEICAFTSPTPPDNDVCADAIPIGLGVTAGTTVNATTEDNGEPFCGARITSPGVWYAYEATARGTVSATLCGTILNPKISVYTGDCDALSCEIGVGVERTCSINPIVDFKVLPGTTYYILVHGFARASGDFDLELSFVPPPANDSCSTAEALPVQIDTCLTQTLGSNLGALASGELPAPSCGNFGDGTDNWYSIVVPGNGLLDVEMSAAGIQSNWVMSAYSGACGSLTEISCDNDSGDDLFPLLNLVGLTPGETIYIRVFEFRNDLVTDFNICVSSPDPCTSGGDLTAPTIDDDTARPICSETFEMESASDYIYTVDPPTSGVSSNQDCSSAIIWRSPRFTDDCGVDSLSVTFSAASDPAPLQLPDALTYGPNSTEITGQGAFLQIIFPSTRFYGSGSAAPAATRVLYEVFDAQGNSDTCSFVFVITDNQAPTIVANDTTLFLDENGMAFLSIADYEYAITDNCSGDPSITDIFRFEASPVINLQGEDAGAGNGDAAKSLDQILEFNCDDVNNPFIRVEIVGMDAAGNMTLDTITVAVQDTIAPAVVCLDIEVQLDSMGLGGYTELSLFTAMDNCDVDFTPFDQAFPVGCDDVGTPISVDLTVFD
ncbi:MAG: hypothetical protein AAF840_05280, partial [Bacteroidota bacterium]